MGLVKGVLRFVAYGINDIFTEKELKVNRAKAYYQNGENMRKAKKQGKYINGSKGYNRQLNMLNSVTKKNSDRREQFINDILS